MSYSQVFNYDNKIGFEDIITGDNSGCKSLGFARILLEAGGRIEYAVTNKEMAIVLQQGDFKASVEWKGKKYLDGVIGKRSSVYDELPTTIYLPPYSKLVIESQEGMEARVFTAICQEGNEPFLSEPKDVEEGTPGALNWKRKYRFIFGPQSRNMCHVTKYLIVGESVSLPGGWIGFPAHKHDLKDDKEYPLDEIFSIRIKGPYGKYVIQHSYGLEGDEGGAWDEFNKITDDNNAIALPFGYHTSMAVPGCTEYLLWGLAGDAKIYKLQYDDSFKWLSDIETLYTFN